MLRAFYRCQLARDSAGSLSPNGWTIKPYFGLLPCRGVRQTFIGSFEPWEAQQIDHVDFFVTRLCGPLVRQCRKDRDDETPRANIEFVSDFVPHIQHIAQFMRVHPDLAGAALGTMTEPHQKTRPNNIDYGSDSASCRRRALFNT